MDRERIEQLLKMAHEIEQLESQAAMRLDPVASATVDQGPWSDSQAPLSFVQARKDQVKAMKAAQREQAAAGRWRRVVTAAAALLLATGAASVFAVNSVNISAIALEMCDAGVGWLDAAAVHKPTLRLSRVTSMAMRNP